MSIREEMSKKRAFDASSIGEPEHKRSSLRGRAVILSLVVILLYVFINFAGITGEFEPFVYFDIDTYVPTAGAIAPLIIILFVLNPLSRFLKKKFNFMKGDLLIVYVMVLFGGMAVGHGFFNWVIFAIPALPEIAMLDDRYAGFLDRVSTLIMPKSEDTILGFWLGKDSIGLTSVPWGEWIMPLVLWGIYYFVIMLMGLCLATIFRRRWTEIEHLSFPITQAPLALIGSVQDDGSLGEFWKDKLMWVGFAFAGIATSVTLAKRYLPWLPTLTGAETMWLQAIVKPLANTEIGRAALLTSRANLDLSVVGIGYFIVSLDLLFSVVFFRFIFKTVLDLILMRYGFWERAGGYLGLGYLHVPAALSIGLVLTWMLRKEFYEMFTIVFGRKGNSVSHEESMSWRLAVISLVAGFVFLFAFSVIFYTASALWAFIILICLFMLFIAHARIRTDGGVGLNAVFGARLVDETFFPMLGTRVFSKDVLAGLAPMGMIGESRLTGTMAGALEAYSIADKVNVKRSSVNIAIMIACAFGMIAGSVIGLNKIYEIGGYNIWIFQVIPRMTYVSSMPKAMSGQVPSNSLVAGIGIFSMIFAAFLSFMRSRFVWWPFNPFGYVAGVAPYGDLLYTWSFLIVWLIKLPIYRYGGRALYNKLKPMFIGFIIGPMVAKMLFGILSVFL